MPQTIDQLTAVKQLAREWWKEANEPCSSFLGMNRQAYQSAMAQELATALGITLEDPNAAND